MSTPHRHRSVVIIGAGQAGLAMSRELTAQSIDHVVLERGVVANAWHTARWSSLRLLTPNWLSELPGQAPSAQPDEFMSGRSFAASLARYAADMDAPVEEGVTVLGIDSKDDGFCVRTTSGTWMARSVVVAAGAFGTPRVPAVAGAVPGRIAQLTPARYRDPNSVADGTVMVVGASASGIQLAEELRRAGRRVIIAVGEHTRLPRRYRGMDIHWWMRQLGVLDQPIGEIDDPVRARRAPAPQLVGSAGHRTLDLNTLQDQGIEIVGRMVGCDDRRIQLSGSLANLCTSADLKMGRMLDAVDEYVASEGLASEVEAPDRPAPTRLGSNRLEVGIDEVDTIVWATGYRPHAPYLEADLVDRKGAIVHDGGVMRRAGMFVLGLPFLRRRWSHFIGGVGSDAAELAPLVRQHLDDRALAAR